MSGWSGFTEEDVHRLKQESDAKQAKKSTRHTSKQDANRPIAKKHKAPLQQNKIILPLKRGSSESDKEVR